MRLRLFAPALVLAVLAAPAAQATHDSTPVLTPSAAAHGCGLVGSAFADPSEPVFFREPI